ncbi:aminotransferase class III-fold pyridoxal phosphate-dependent enzyme [Leucobacter denitrificans]|uniref:Aminotransferase class III-fold pyridoxal phosphate-dependent enzyme n=1 Tax=Leucobacter denitrificans TaxID=683042 RepID=A0A7G9S295_9MICO|nr:aminotransferase class III-fold pyridoxal phosphate-dependent enzyme [Leucobacter denitrificans]QNN61970.1 aminotransferase class III-fold pyridoxal phosphate-dependent enzyme [Leucobacter denitrificans]
METLEQILANETPTFSHAELESTMERLYGFTSKVQTVLSSERDQVVLLRGESCEERILKVSNSAELESNVSLENAAAEWVRRADPDLPLAGPMPTLTGELSGSLDGHFVRVYPKLEGTASIHGSTLGSDEIKQYGEAVARFAKALRGFFHPSADRKVLWHIESLDRVRNMTHHLGESGRRQMVERTFERFDARVAPRWNSLRAQVVHSDMLLDNVLMDDGIVSGIIDLGDLTHTALVADVAAAFTSLGDMRQGDDLFTAFRLFLDGYERITPLEPLERELLGDVLAARLATTVTLGAWRAAEHPNNADFLEAWEGAAWSQLEQLDELGPEAVAQKLGVYPTVLPQSSLLEERNRVFGSGLVPLTYSDPLYPVSGRGATVTEADGTVLVDAYNNIPSLGYAHPRVARAIADETRTLSTNLRYLHPRAIQLAERIIESMPADLGLDTVLFMNSGSEANDLAWRIASAASERDGAIVTDMAFHSVTMAGTELSPGEWLQDMRADRIARFTPGGSIENAIDVLASRNLKAAAMFVDPVYGSDGILTFSKEYHAALSASAHAAGIRVVVDEVQGGYARTGEHLWSFAAVGLRPDIVTLGKPMGNGYPIAAVVARSSDVDALGRHQELFSSFAGSPVAAAAGLAVLDVIRDENLIAESARKGAYLRERILEEIGGSPNFKGFRGIGLLFGVEFDGHGSGKPIVDFARREGVMLSATGFAWDTIKIRPPLVITDAQLDFVARTIGRAVANSR